jgi:hypothetical protein
MCKDRRPKLLKDFGTYLSIGSLMAVGRCVTAGRTNTHILVVWSGIFFAVVMISVAK